MTCFVTINSILCNLVSWRRIEIGDFFITKPSLRDKDGRIDTQCTEYVLSRSDQRSTIYCRIPGEKKIEPVIEIRIVGIIGIHGIEVSVHSTRDLTQTSWVLISIGKSRYANQMEDPDVSHNVPSSNLLR